MSGWRHQAAALLLGWACAAVASAQAPAEGGAAFQGPSGAARIEARLASAVVTERPVDGFSAEGTRVTAWQVDRARLKIGVEALGESGRRQYDFYWLRGALIAAHARRIDYGTLITRVPAGQPLPQRVVEDTWVEYREGAAVRVTRDGAAADVRGTAERAQADALAAQARSFRALMRAPAGTEEGCRWTCATDWQDECRRFVCR